MLSKNEKAMELAMNIEKRALEGGNTKELIEKGKKVMEKYGQAAICEVGKGRLLDAVRNE